MRILILNTWYFPNMKGGAEHSVKLLAEGLAQAGHTVGVFTIDSKDGKFLRESINGVYVFRGTGGIYDVNKAYTIKRGPILGLIKKCIELWNFSIVKDLGVVYNEFKPELVHANCISGISLKSISFFRERGLPIIYTLRDFYLDNHKNVNEKLLPNNLIIRLFVKNYRWFSNVKTRNVEAVIAPSESMLSYILNNGCFKNSKIKEVVCNCIPIDIEQTKKYIQEKQSHLNRNYLYAGSLVEVKGVREMIEAFVSSGVKGTLTLCGEGPLEEYVKKASSANSSVIFKGKLSSQDLELEYRKSDVIIVPSLWAEPFGRVVIEGAKYGLVVIGSNQGGIPEIINHIGCGYVWDTKSNFELRNLIIKSSTDTFDMFYSGIIEKLCFYSQEKQIKNYTDIYKTLVANNRDID